MYTLRYRYSTCVCMCTRMEGCPCVCVWESERANVGATGCSHLSSLGNSGLAIHTCGPESWPCTLREECTRLGALKGPAWLLHSNSKRGQVWGGSMNYGHATHSSAYQESTRRSWAQIAPASVWGTTQHCVAAHTRQSWAERKQNRLFKVCLKNQCIHQAGYTVVVSAT